MILDLLFINLIVVLAHASGFFEYLDDWVSRKWRFHHLPKIMVCALCQTFWLSMLFILVTGQFTIPGILLCFVNAHLTDITIPLVQTIKNFLLKIIGWMNDFLQ